MKWPSLVAKYGKILCFRRKKSLVGSTPGQTDTGKIVRTVGEFIRILRMKIKKNRSLKLNLQSVKYIHSFTMLVKITSFCLKPMFTIVIQQNKLHLFSFRISCFCFCFFQMTQSRLRILRSENANTRKSNLSLSLSFTH